MIGIIQRTQEVSLEELPLDKSGIILLKIMIVLNYDYSYFILLQS